MLSSQSLGGRPLSAGDQTGKRIGAYTLGLHLATGAFGQVYVAQGPGGECAFKLGPLTDLRRFERELAALRGISHPGLIRYIDGGTLIENGREFYWLAMEYPGPVTLSDWIAEGPVNIILANSVFRQILDAIQALHNAGLIHRDLKPSNILVNNGSVKIIDFGLTKSMIRLEQTQLTLTGQMMGTPRYMSPEQVNGMREVGPAADLWSAIVIFFEMLTGAPLFEGANEMQLGAQILGADLESRIMSQFIPVFLRPWFLEYLDRAEPRTRCSVGEVRGAFEQAVQQFHQRENELLSRLSWKAIREKRIIEGLFEGGAPVSVHEIERAFRAACLAQGLQLPPDEETSSMLAVAIGAFADGGLTRLTTELGGQFRKVKSRTPENQKYKVWMGMKHKRRAYAWLAVSAVFACICLAGFLLLASNDKQKKQNPDPVQIALGTLGMLGGGALTALSFFLSAKAWNSYTSSLPTPQFGVTIPDWESCPGSFFCFEKGQYWETREQLTAGAQRVEFKLEMGFEGAQFITDADLHALLPFANLAVLRLNRCKRLTDRALEVAAQFSRLKWLDVSDTLVTEAGVSALLGRVYPARLDLAGCINLKPTVAVELAEARMFELDLGFNDWVGPVSMRALSASASLRGLALPGCRSLDDEAVEYLSRIALKTLNLRWCEKVTDVGLAAISRIQFLENLDLRGLSRITDGGLLLLSSLKYLKLLHVSDCVLLTQRGIEELRRALPLCHLDNRGEFELPHYLY